MIQKAITGAGVVESTNILGLAHDSGYNYSLWHYMNQDYFALTAGAWGGKNLGYTNEDVTFTAKKALVGKFWSSYNFGAVVNVYKNGTLLFSTSYSTPAFHDIQLDAGDTLRVQHSTSYDRTEWFMLINPSVNINTELVWSVNYT